MKVIIKLKTSFTIYFKKYSLKKKALKLFLFKVKSQNYSIEINYKYPEYFFFSLQYF